MYNVIKNVISNKLFELTDMLRKIDTFWLQGNLSDEERDELINLARANADLTKTIDLYKAVEDLDRRVRILEENKTPAPEHKPEETYPEFELNKQYRNGDMISFEGKKYKCICPSYTVCVWSPSGYPDYWKEVK